jgi:hypothetical protein
MGRLVADDSRVLKSPVVVPARARATDGKEAAIVQPRTTTATKYDIWSYRDPSWSNLSGFDVEALDGSLGKVADESKQTASSYIVVDTGPLIFGRKVVLPAGTIKSVDRMDRKVFVNRTKDQIKNAPEFDEKMGFDDPYRTRLGTYYESGTGWKSDVF